MQPVLSVRFGHDTAAKSVTIRPDASWYADTTNAAVLFAFPDSFAIIDRPVLAVGYVDLPINMPGLKLTFA